MKYVNLIPHVVVTMIFIISFIKELKEDKDLNQSYWFSILATFSLFAFLYWGGFYDYVGEFICSFFTIDL